MTIYDETCRLRPTPLTGNVPGSNSFFPGTDINLVPVCHLADGAAMVVMELSCVPVPDIGEGRAADQEQDGGNGEDAFHGGAPLFDLRNNDNNYCKYNVNNLPH